MSSADRAAPVVAPLSYVLPFPPSVNRYYRHVGYRTLLSREGREYRENVCSLLAGRVGQPLSGQLQVQLDLFPPDARRRDWDNFQKGVWDSLQHAGVYLDDSQVKRAVVEMHPPSRPGHAAVVIRPFTPSPEEDRLCPPSFTNEISSLQTSLPMIRPSSSSGCSRSQPPTAPKKPTRRMKRAT
ncbi:MAG: RusA family crossover junction endodeoxyribonuclease [Planctomycetota bacterium]|nr:MAG: RusA family crossover junction endodeoxyribonuclease [Planctomycetota bacterium]